VEFLLCPVLQKNVGALHLCEQQSCDILCRKHGMIQNKGHSTDILSKGEVFWGKFCFEPIFTKDIGALHTDVRATELR